MRQISRFFLSVLSALVLMGVVACVPASDNLNPDPWNAQSYEDRKVNWCEHVYYIHQDIQLCSMWKLTGDQIKVEPYVFIVPMKLINDRDVFKRTDSWDRIAGRYITNKGWIFVTERAFTDEGYTDLPHEVAHWLNNNIGGIAGTPKDERLADAFEAYYVKECRGCK